VERAQELLTESLTEIVAAYEAGVTPRPWSEFQIGMIHTLLGQHDQALDWLEESQASGLNWEALWLQEAAIDPHRGNPRFERILERVRAEDARMRANVLAELEGRPVA
jgi:hypothetical protein